MHGCHLRDGTEAVVCECLAKKVANRMEKPAPNPIAETVDAEVIPPKQAGVMDNEVLKHALAKIVAHWLDELIRLPGTKLRVGLEPIMAILPGIGEFLASSVSLATIVASIRAGVSATVVGRMGLNMMFNALLGIIPGIGPGLSAFFKSNSRNLQLLQRWQEGQGAELTKQSRWLIYGVLAVILGFFALMVVVWVYYVWTIWSFLARLMGFTH